MYTNNDVYTNIQQRYMICRAYAKKIVFQLLQSDDPHFFGGFIVELAETHQHFQGYYVTKLIETKH